MHKILMINEEKVALGDENNNLVTVPRTAVSYENPAVCIWHIPTAGFAEQNGRNAKLNGRIIFDY